MSHLLGGSPTHRKILWSAKLFPCLYLSLHQCGSETKIQQIHWNFSSKKELNHHHVLFLKPHDDDQIKENPKYYQALLHPAMFRPRTQLRDLVLGWYLQALELSAGSQAPDNSNIKDSWSLAGLGTNLRQSWSVFLFILRNQLWFFW